MTSRTAGPNTEDSYELAEQLFDPDALVGVLAGAYETLREVGQWIDSQPPGFDPDETFPLTEIEEHEAHAVLVSLLCDGGVFDPDWTHADEGGDLTWRSQNGEPILSWRMVDVVALVAPASPEFDRLRERYPAATDTALAIHLQEEPERIERNIQAEIRDALPAIEHAVNEAAAAGVKVSKQTRDKMKAFGLKVPPDA